MKIEKALKNVDVDTVKELEALSPEDLNARVVAANQAMQEMEAALDANQDYQDLLESKKAMEQGKKEVDKRQKSIITICLALKEGKGFSQS